MQNTPVLHQPVYNPEVESYLIHLDHELTDFAQIQGKEDGQKATEPTEVVYKITVFDPVHSKIQMAIDFIRKTLLSTSFIIGAAEADKAAQKKVQDNTNEINDQIHKLAPLKRKIATVQIDQQKKKHAKWLMIVAIFVGLADAALAYGSFRHGAYTVIQALLAAAAIGAVISLSHLVYAGWISQAATPKQRLIRIFTVLTIAFIFFAWIGNLRAKATGGAINIGLEDHNVTAASAPQINGWAIAIISFVLFMVVFFLSLVFRRSKAERLEEEEFNRTKTEIAKIENKIAALKKENIDVKSAAIELKKEARKIYDYAISCIRRAKSIGVNAIARYMQTYARFHNTVPSFFENPNDVPYDESFQFPKQQNIEQV